MYVLAHDHKVALAGISQTFAAPTLPPNQLLSNQQSSATAQNLQEFLERLEMGLYQHELGNTHSTDQAVVVELCATAQGLLQSVLLSRWHPIKNC
jgi:hypothetical protein